MNITDLADAIRAHAGEFDCSEIHGKRRKTVAFRHVTTPPGDAAGLPDIGRLREFYAALGSVLFYVDETTGDAARHLAAPGAWPELDDAFREWLFDDEDLEDWVEDCLVIGETPHSGNYILMATGGDVAGRVFEFDHDGFEFRDCGADIVEYAGGLLAPDGERLTDFASHLRFVEAGDDTQWWIETMRDAGGRVVATRE